MRSSLAPWLSEQMRWTDFRYCCVCGEPAGEEEDGEGEAAEEDKVMKVMKMKLHEKKKVTNVMKMKLQKKVKLQKM